MTFLKHIKPIFLATAVVLSALSNFAIAIVGAPGAEIPHDLASYIMDRGDEVVPKSQQPIKTFRLLKDYLGQFEGNFLSITYKQKGLISEACTYIAADLVLAPRDKKTYETKGVETRKIVEMIAFLRVLRDKSIWVFDWKPKGASVHKIFAVYSTRSDSERTYLPFKLETPGMSKESSVHNALLYLIDCTQGQIKKPGRITAAVEELRKPEFKGLFAEDTHEEIVSSVFKWLEVINVLDDPIFIPTRPKHRTISPEVNRHKAILTHLKESLVLKHRKYYRLVCEAWGIEQKRLHTNISANGKITANFFVDFPPINLTRDAITLAHSWQYSPLKNFRVDETALSKPERKLSGRALMLIPGGQKRIISFHTYQKVGIKLFYIMPQTLAETLIADFEYRHEKLSTVEEDLTPFPLQRKGMT